MPEFFVLCERKRDKPVWMIDFHLERGMVRVNTALVDDCFPLESLASELKGFMPGMVLIRRKWSRFYALKIRDGWGENEYFELADRLIKERGLEKTDAMLRHRNGDYHR